MDDGQGTMWDYWQENPRGQTKEEELKELCGRLAQLLHEAVYRIPEGPWLDSTEQADLEKGLSYAS